MEYDLTVSVNTASGFDRFHYITTSLVGNITDGLMFIGLRNNGQLVLSVESVISLSFATRAPSENKDYDNFVSDLQKDRVNR